MHRLRHLHGELRGAVVEHIEGHAAVPVAVIGTKLDVARVGRDAREGEQAGLLVHHGVDLVDGIAADALQVADRGGVDGSAAGAHDEAVERREAHGGVHVLAVLDRGERSAGAEVAAHELVGLAIGELRRRAPDEAVRGAVRTVLADVQLVDHVAGKGVAIGLLGDAVVEGGVRDDDVADGREHVTADLDDVGLGVVVKRGERSDLADPAERLVGDDLGLGEVPAALNDAVTDSLDLARVEARLVENLEDVLDGGLVIGKGDLELLLGATVLLMADERAVDADALAVALRIDLVRGGVEQLILERRTASIDDQDVHWTPLVGTVLRTHDTPVTSVGASDARVKKRHTFLSARRTSSTIPAARITHPWQGQSTVPVSIPLMSRHLVAPASLRKRSTSLRDAA